MTAIELIEHLPNDVLELFPKTVFGCMKPKIVILTTPNQEYNVLFNNFEGPFRHYDHSKYLHTVFMYIVRTVMDKSCSQSYSVKLL